MKNFNLEKYFGTDSISRAAKLYSVISEERFLIKDLDIPYRQINHWDEKGIISFSRKITEGWRKFSFVELVWIKMVDEFRQFGIPLDIIAKVKKDIFEGISMKEIFALIENKKEQINKIKGNKKAKQKISSVKSKDIKSDNPFFSWLHLFVADAITNQADYSIMVFQDGFWLPWANGKQEAELDEDVEFRLKYTSHMVVSITGIIREFITQSNVEQLTELNLVSENEARIIELISKPAFEKAEVNLIGKRQKVELLNNETDKRKIIAIICDHAYDQILIRDKKGLELKVTRTE
ncbi:MAG: MerR family transcriptional regulator [Bacteroidota bacterium]